MVDRSANLMGNDDDGNGCHKIQNQTAPIFALFLSKCFLVFRRRLVVGVLSIFSFFFLYFVDLLADNNRVLFPDLGLGVGFVVELAVVLVRVAM